MDFTGGNQPARAGFEPSNFLRSFVGTVRAVVLEPAGFFRDLRRQGSSGSFVLFAVICFVINFPLVEIATPAQLWLLGETYPGLGRAFWILLVLSPLFAWIVVYLSAAFQHLFVMIFARPRGGFDETLRASAYASAVALVSWVPFVGYAASAYGLYITMLGLRELHGTTTTRALLAVLVPALIFLASIVWSYWP
jgi:hypothetical protein